MTKLTFSAVQARQSPHSTVLSFAASASEVLGFAAIDRVARDADGRLSGFQRPQIAAHIREIRDYLETAEASCQIRSSWPSLPVLRSSLCRAARARFDDVSGGPRGLIVDGQQRITALSQVEGKDFQVFISALVCRDEADSDASSS